MITRPRSFIIVLFLVCLGLVLLYRPASYNSFSPAAPPATRSPAPTVSATLVIDFGSQKSTSSTRDLPATSSAFSLLRKVTTRQNIPLTFKEYPFGTMVESINGLKNNSQKSWIYFVNGKSPDVGADKYIINSGDRIEWRYIKPAI